MYLGMGPTDVRPTAAADNLIIWGYLMFGGLYGMSLHHKMTPQVVP
jgi:hypothetical protein